MTALTALEASEAAASLGDLMRLFPGFIDTRHGPGLLRTEARELLARTSLDARTARVLAAAAEQGYVLLHRCRGLRDHVLCVLDPQRRSLRQQEPSVF